MYDQAGFLAMGQNDRLLKLRHRTAAAAFGQYDPVFRHFLFDLRGDAILKRTFLRHAGTNREDHNADQRQQQDQHDQFDSVGMFCIGLFHDFSCHSNHFFLFIFGRQQDFARASSASLEVSVNFANSVCRNSLVATFILLLPANAVNPK